MKDFTLVSTVYNEISRLDLTIEDIENQTIKPSEIVVADAGSTDGTYERLLLWQKHSSIPIKLYIKPRCNVAEGRNLAIENASHDLIASTDFGCRFHKDWLKSLIEPFNDNTVQVVGGGYTVIEDDIQSLASKANFLLSAGYTSIMDTYFIPSSRSIAYHKKVWAAVGGYAEWLTLAADDLVFGKVLKSQGYKFHLVDQPYVYWGRHIAAKSYGKEAFRYGLGDGEARVNIRQFIKTIVESVLRVAFVLFAVLTTTLVITHKASPVYFLFLLPFIYGFKPYVNSLKNWLRMKSEKYSLKVFLYSLYLVELTRWNYMKGYFKGYFFSNPRQKSEAIRLSKVLNS